MDVGIVAALSILGLTVIIISCTLNDIRAAIENLTNTIKALHIKDKGW